MAGDWQGIPGNEHVFERLIDLMASGGAIGFVTAWSGLHLSTPSGLYATLQGSGSVVRWFTDRLFRFRARDLQ